MENYQLIGKIGEGSFGRVYKARRRYTGRVVAVKMVNKLGQSADDLRALRSETEILRKVNHQNVMRLLDVLETDGDICLVTELGRGDLFQVISDKQTLPESQMKQVAVQLVSALDDLHQNRIIHRDMKPQNVLIGANGCLKVCDFGFARALSETSTVLSSMKGTPLYMAPELVQEKLYTSKVDVWSLGIILYELHFGKPPFYTTSIYKMIQMIVNDDIVFPAEISPQFRDFLCHMLQKNPDERWDCAALLGHPFLEYLTIEPFDDVGYMTKSHEFDQAIEESFSPGATCPFRPPADAEPDYQSILTNPGEYTPEEVAVAVRYVGATEENAGSAVAAMFVRNFSVIVAIQGLMNDALITATMLLKADATAYIAQLQPGLMVVSDPGMPVSGVDFMTEMLLLPHVARRVSLVGLECSDVTFDVDSANRLRDKMLSFVFASDPLEASKSYAVLSYLAQTSAVFVGAISGHSASQVVPIVTSAAIHRIAPAVTAGAFAILGKIVEKDVNAIQCIQPITGFIDSLMTVLKMIPETIEDMCVFAAALTFTAVSFPHLSRLTDFQRKFGTGDDVSSVDKFMKSYFTESMTARVAGLLKLCMKEPDGYPETLAFVSLVESPLANFPLDPFRIEAFVQEIGNLLRFHQPMLLAAIFKLPVTDIIAILPSVAKFWDTPDLSNELVTGVLRIMKDMKGKNKMVLVSTLIKSGVLMKVAQRLEATGHQQVVAGNIAALLTHAIIAIPEPWPELVSQAETILQCVFKVQKAVEAGLIIASHFTRLSADLIDVVNRCGALGIAEEQLQKGGASTRARALNFAGNMCRYRDAKPDACARIVKVSIDAMIQDQDQHCRRNAAYAVGNAIYHAPECGDAVLKEIDAITAMFSSDDPIAINHAAGIICNLIHADEQYLDRLMGAIEKMAAIVTRKNKEVCDVIIMRLPTLCRYPTTRKVLAAKDVRTAISKLKSDDHAVKATAEQIMKIIGS